MPVEVRSASQSLAGLLRLGVAVVVIAAYVVDGWISNDYAGTPRARFVVAGVAACGLAWTAWPRIAPIAAVAASLGSFALTVRLQDRSRFPFFTEAVVLTLLLGAVLWRRAEWSWPVATLIVVSGVAISLRADDNRIRNILAATMLVLFAAMVAAAVQTRMKDDERRVGIERARRDERLELARELHDIVGHHVTGIVVLAQASRFASAGGRDGHGVDTDRALADIERAGLETLTSVRRLVGLLREDAPTTAAPQLADVEQLVADLRATHPQAVLETDAAIRAGWVPADLAATVYRLLQEATTNVRKHGDPDAPVVVALRRDLGSIDLEVQNRCLTVAPTRDSGYGLIGMRERVHALGGRFAAGPSGEQMWRVHVALPLAGGT